MKSDKLKMYLFGILLLVILFFALFVSKIITRVVFSVLLFGYMLLVVFLIKKRRIKSMYHQEVIILMFIFALIYILAFYLMGLYFGYYEAPIKLSWWSLLNYTLPIGAVIISSEVIRNAFLSQKGKSIKVVTFVSMVIIDMIIYSGIYEIDSVDKLLTVVGFLLFASISCNLLYNYISYRYGSKSIIIYRLITVLYAYLIPIIPNVYAFFRSFLRMMYPYIIYLVLENSYSKSSFIVAYKDKRKGIVSTTIVFICSILVIMLISCKFKYGMIVIGSGSMTGTINKGDALVYERYDDQTIKKGQIILFDDEGVLTVHRVIDIKEVNGKVMYFTKGDANASMDDGYRVEKDIVGLSKFKIIYIGYPSLWMRDIFSK